jgi:hypothetical protein
MSVWIGNRALNEFQTNLGGGLADENRLLPQDEVVDDNTDRHVRAHRELVFGINLGTRMLTWLARHHSEDDKILAIHRGDMYRLSGLPELVEERGHGVVGKRRHYYVLTGTRRQRLGPESLGADRVQDAISNREP